MTAERIDPTDWPAIITQGPGYYGLRIDTDHGTAVHYLDASTLMAPTPPNWCDSRPGRACPATPRKGESPKATKAAELNGDGVTLSGRAHAGARCEEAA